MAMMRLLFLTMRDLARSRARLQVELLAVRHQLHVLERTRPRRVRLSALDRWLWVWLSRVWSEWRRVLVIVEPATVVAWHRRGVRCSGRRHSSWRGATLASSPRRPRGTLRLRHVVDEPALKGRRITDRSHVHVVVDLDLVQPVSGLERHLAAPSLRA